MKVFDGRTQADALAAKLRTEAAQLSPPPPHLAIVTIEPDEPTSRYIKAKMARAKEIGIETQLCLLNHTTTAKAQDWIVSLANDPKIDGIILQLPLPKNFPTSDLVKLIPAQKDVDGMRYADDKSNFVPATVLAIAAAFDDAQVKLDTKQILIIGYGELVGKPLERFFKQQGLNPQIADTDTKNLTQLIAQADVIVSATGKAHLSTADMVKPEAIVIDVGVSVQNGKVQGDVDFENVKSKASFITPPTGGIGPMTVVMLLANTLKAAKNRK